MPMLSGYADENVDAAIVEGLRRRGMDVATAQERGQRQTDDEILLQAATAEGRLMLTNDTDFPRIHSEWMSAGRDHAGIIFWRLDLSPGPVIKSILDFASQTAPQDAVNMLVFVKRN